MAQKNLNDKEAQRQENIEQTVSATERFFNENKKTIWCAVAAVLVIGLGILAYNKFIYQPNCVEAMQQSYPAEMSFQNGEYELALNGDGNVLGLADVISEYGSKAGAAVFMEAGVCALQLGQYEDALSYLKRYNGKEPILAARAIACQGDAYVALENYPEAVAAYRKAAATADNEFASAYLLKAGLVYEQMGDNAKAVECYEIIKDKYAGTPEGYEIDKYITRAQTE